MTSHTTPLPLNLDKLPHESLQHAPPSPTFSTASFISHMSWLADKGPQDLIPLLKNAYSAIKEKEKDLTLAAEIGKQLLSTNVQLEQNYRQLLQQQHYIEEQVDEPEMDYLPSTNARQVIIEVLEQKNNELNERLESLSTEHAAMKNTSGKRTKQLEAEMAALQTDLEMATSKIQELEGMNQKQQRRHIQTQKDPSIDRLLNDVQRLEAEHQQAIEAKRTMETKLAAALADLHQLKQQFDNFEFTESGYKTLQQTYDRQFQHITQLNQALEDHRAVFQKLRDRGISVHSTPCPSVIMKQNDQDNANEHHHTLLEELESEWIKRNHQQETSQPSSSTPPSSSSSSSSYLFSQFFGETMDPFESLVTKATGLDHGLIDDALHLINQLEQDIKPTTAAPLSAVADDVYLTTWTNASDRANSNNSDDGKSSDLHLALVEYAFPSQDLYPDLPSSGTVARYDPSMTRPGLVRQWINKAFQRIWRWFRFAFVLSTAVMISLWSGPDGMPLAIANQ